MLDAACTCGDDRKKFSMALVNRHPERPLDCKLAFSGSLSFGHASLTVLAGDSPDAYNDVDHPRRVIPEKRQWTVRNDVIQLPPHSVSVLRF